ADQPGFTLDDTGSDSEDGYTSNGLLQLTDFEAGATWQYNLDGSTWQDGSGTALDLDGQADGDIAVQVRQTDLAGNTSSSGSITFTLDKVAAAPDIALLTDSGTDGDGISSSGVVLVSGLEAA